MLVTSISNFFLSWRKECLCLDGILSSCKSLLVNASELKTFFGVIFFHGYNQCLDRVLSSLFVSQILVNASELKTFFGVIFFHWYKQCLDRVLSSLFLSQIKTMHFLSRIETVLEQTFMQFYMFHRWKQYLVTALKLKSFSCIKLWSFVEVPCSKSNNITGWAPKSICKEPHYPINKSIFDLYAVNGFNFIRDLLMY